METIKCVLLGLLQGLTEFLPVSSSGHLVIGSKLLGISSENATLEVLLHFGTLISVFIFFRHDIKNLLSKGLTFLPEFLTLLFSNNVKLPKKNLEHSYYLYFIFLSSLPAIIVALLFKTELEKQFVNYKLTLICLLITGLVLLLSRLSSEKKGHVLNGRFALLIGLVQAIAILPGISRSGTTIVMGMFLGLEKEKVARFSFLMSLPVIFGAFLLKINTLFSVEVTHIELMSYFLGTLVATISGYYAIKFVLRFVSKGKFSMFGYYCIVLSLLGFFFI